MSSPKGQQLLDFTNYSTRKVDGTVYITGGQVCNNNFPCYQFSDGAVVQTNNGPPNRDAYTYFSIDPDGTGGREPMTVVFDYAMGRLTSRDALVADGFVSIPPNGLTTFADPDYAAKWTSPTH